VIDVIDPNNITILNNVPQDFTFTPDTNGEWVIRASVTTPGESHIQDVVRLVIVTDGPVASAVNGAGGVLVNIPMTGSCTANCGTPAALPWSWEITDAPSGGGPNAPRFVDTDDSFSTLQNPTLDARKEGVHELTLTYTDSLGNYGTTTVSFTVGP